MKGSTMDASTPPVTENAGGMPPTGGGEVGTPPTTQATPSNPAAMPLESAIFDEALKKDPTVLRYKDVDSALKGLIEANKKIGEKSGIKPLTAESTAEDIAAYRTAMGVPEKPDGYELGNLAYPEDATPTEAQMANWRGVFHQAHLTPAQVQMIMQAHAHETSQQYAELETAQQAESDEAKQALIKKYGALAPQMAEMTKNFVERFYGKEGLESLQFGPGQKSAIGNNPIVVDMAIRLAKYTGHDQFIIGDSRGGAMGKEGAQAKINELWAMHREKKISDAEFNRQMEPLQQIVHSNTP
jgi:hypothetical protein